MATLSPCMHTGEISLSPNPPSPRLFFTSPLLGVGMYHWLLIRQALGGEQGWCGSPQVPPLLPVQEWKASASSCDAVLQTEVLGPQGK